MALQSLVLQLLPSSLRTKVPDAKKGRVMRAIVSGLAIITSVFVVAGETPADGAPITMVSPSEFADHDANGAVTNTSIEGRFQQVFLASDFDSLPPEYRMITHLAFRRDVSLAQSMTTTYDDFATVLASLVSQRR